MSITLDFETEGIQSRPDYPPKPVGVAIELNGVREYYAFGHQTGNNCSREAAARVVRAAFRGVHGPVLMHNSIFDIDVAMTHFGVGPPKEFHDTLYLAFLMDPRSESLSLKPLAERYCGIKPRARDAVFDWLSRNVAEVRKSPKRAGEFICAAPGDLVGKYAEDDVRMTEAVWKKLYRPVCEQGMQQAYLVERDLTLATLDMESNGVRVDVKGLKDLHGALVKFIAVADKMIRRTLGVGADFNVSSGPQLGTRLAERGLLSKVVKTATGKQSTAMAVLLETCTDAKLVELLQLRAVAEKYRSTFVEPWLAQAAKTGGRVMPRFNQVRNRASDGTGGGTRTGRYSSADPNFQQIPTNADESRNGEVLMLLAKKLKRMYGVEFHGLRHYILPDKGMYWAAIDYSQQELRILAHFEKAALCAEYNRNAKLDVHAYVQTMVKAATGVEYPRKYIKTVVFGLIYGMGAFKLAKMLNISNDEGYRLHQGVLAALPGVRDLMRSTRGTIWTWGGRRYDVEPPAVYDGDEDTEPETRSFEYKQLNYLIQGSAADCTKRGMLNVLQAGIDCRIALQVHDELGVMVKSKKDAERVRDAMCDMHFNVPMRAEVKLSKKSWGECK